MPLSAGDKLGPYEVLFDSGPRYMVMERIEGESLADRIAKGPSRSPRP